MNATPVVVMLLPPVDYDPTESAVTRDALTTPGVEVRFATPDGERLTSVAAWRCGRQQIRLSPLQN